MSSTTDALQALLATARGQRPKSMACAEAEEVLNIAMALLVELAVAGDRIDRLERLVAELRGQPVDALREIAYDGDAAEERQAATDALIARALRIMVDPRAAARSNGEAG